MSFASQAHYGASQGHPGQACDQAHPGASHEDWEYQVSFGADPHSDFMAAVNTWCEERPPSFGWGYESLEGFGAAFGSQTRAIIRTGSRGNAVKSWQEALNRWLTATGASTIGVDSAFGPATANATRSFQGSQGLGQDGVVGQRTRTAMDHWATTQSGVVAGPPPTISQSPASQVISLSHANQALRNAAPPGAVSVSQVFWGPSQPPPAHMVKVEGRNYHYLDANRRVIAPRAQAAPPSPGAPPLFAPPPPQHGPPQTGLPPAPEKADMKPLYIAAGVGATALIIIALTTRRG